MKDLAWNKDKGYWDISFEDGDYKQTSFLDTAILMSLLIDKRASKSEVPSLQLRRGWWGNKVGDYPNYEIGSKLWLLSQSRLTQETLNLLKTYSYDCLTWLIDDGYVDRVETNASRISEGVFLTIILYVSQNIIFKKMYEWQKWGEYGYTIS